MGGGGRTNDPCPRPAPAGYGGLAVSSSIGSKEEHITLYFDINQYFNKSKSVHGSACAYSTCTQIKPIT